MYGPLLLISGSHTKLTLSIDKMTQPMKQSKPAMKPVQGMTKSNAPVAKGIVQKASKPKFTMPKSDGSIRISHREYVDDINGSVLFSGVVSPINPGISACFPWLSTLASSYESYRFNRLRFIFESTSATTHTGAVMMAVDYDPDDTPPTNKTQLMSYSGAVRGPPWESFDLSCSKADLQKLPQRFIRLGINDLATKDNKLYDTGNLFLFTAGQQNSNLVGELYVEYEVDLFTPQLDLNATSLAQSAIVLSGGTVSFTNWLGTAPTVKGGLPVFTSLSPTGFYVEQAGSYFIQITSAGSGQTIASPTVTSPGNQILVGAYAASQGVSIHNILVQVNVTGSLITITGLHTAGTINASNIRIMRYAFELG